MKNTKELIKQKSQTIEKQAISNSCLPWFNRIIEVNKNNGWINAEFKPSLNEQFKDQFFTIEFDDYLEIESNWQVEIYRISKRWGKIIIYCRVNLFN
jgi:hypothetical protein